MAAILSTFLLAVEILCALGPSSSYNAYSDQRPTGDAMQLAGQVNAALVSACRPNCPTIAMFRNPTAANVMLVSDGVGKVKIVYKPEFFTSIYEAHGDGGILAIIAHEVGHAIDASAPPSWMKGTWTPELRADAWAGCALAKMNLSVSAVRLGVAALSKYPSPSHPDWAARVPVLRLGYMQCGGSGSDV